MPRLNVALRTPPPDNARPVSLGGRPFTRGGATPSAARRRASISSYSFTMTSGKRIRAVKSRSSQRSSGLGSLSGICVSLILGEARSAISLPTRVRATQWRAAMRARVLSVFLCQNRTPAPSQPQHYDEERHRGVAPRFCVMKTDRLRAAIERAVLVALAAGLIVIPTVFTSGADSFRLPKELVF